MLKIIYRTNDGTEYNTRESAIKHEIRFQREAYERALADYQYVRFSEHRFYVKNYLQYKHMTVDEFLKLSGNETLTRTQARKNFGRGESTIRIRSKKVNEQLELENLLCIHK